MINKKNSLIVTLGLWILYSPPLIAQYQSGPEVDARTLDIAGVKIGMNVSDTVEKLSHYYEVPISDIEVYETLANHPAFGHKVPFTAELASPDAKNNVMPTILTGWRITIWFTPIVPFDEQGTVGVSMIKYEIGNTVDNKQALLESAKEKYGAPTVDSWPVQWCDKTANLAHCESDAKLTLSGNELTLEDTAPIHAEIEAINKLNEEKPRI